MPFPSEYVSSIEQIRYGPAHHAVHSPSATRKPTDPSTTAMMTQDSGHCWSECYSRFLLFSVFVFLLKFRCVALMPSTHVSRGYSVRSRCVCVCTAASTDNVNKSPSTRLKSIYVQSIFHLCQFKLIETKWKLSADFYTSFSSLCCVQRVHACFLPLLAVIAPKVVRVFFCRFVAIVYLCIFFSVSLLCSCSFERAAEQRYTRAYRDDWLAMPRTKTILI